MATAYIASVEDLAKARDIEMAIIRGELPQPPALKGKANECATCHKMTMFARYYIPKVGYSCEACWDIYRTTPSWCDTRASDVHLGCRHVPLGIFEEPPTKTPTAAPAPRSDAKPSQDWVFTQIAQIKAQRGPESLATEARWHAYRKAAEAQRGNVMVMPWKAAA